MKDIKFKAYVYDLTDEDSHPLEIDVRAGKLWDVASINFKDRIVEIMDDDGNVWEYELNDEIALLQYTGFETKMDVKFIRIISLNGDYELIGFALIADFICTI